MIEFPESRHLAAQIQENLLGKTVQNVTTNKSPHKFAWFHGDPAEYHGKLAGKAISGTNAYGGMPEIVLGDARLVFCDGTNLRYFAPGAKLPDKHQMHIEFEDGASLVCSVQMYGAMFLMDGSDDDEGYYLTAKTKISPLSEKNTEAYFFELMNGVKQNYSVKAFLATEQRYPGLGNGVLQDILFNARMNPRRKLETLAQREKEAVYQSLKQTLSAMTAAGGRDTEKDIFGQPGGYKTMLSAKTLQYPCPVCGGGLVREAYLGGNVYYCPVCQPKEGTPK